MPSGIFKHKPLSKEIKLKISKTMKKGGFKPTVLRGIDSPNWKGGITPENVRIRNCPEMHLWRKSCLIRDNFTSQKSGQKGGKLEIHHINNFANFPELRFALDNGITLTKEEHKEFHIKYGKKNNTKEQLLEFLTQNSYAIK